MKYLSLIAIQLFACLAASLALAAERPPNVLLILADDLGYGDVRCYNSEAKVATPHVDALAAGGMRFTDAHSPATVCTPTRYSILTGRMAFRTGYRGVFTGVGGPCLIEDSRLTIGGMLQQKGYETAMFGKWHVGMTFFDHAGKPINKGGLDAVKQIDYTRAIPDAPIHRGFDHFYGTVCCPTTDWLYAFVDGDRVPVPPTHQIDKTGLPQNPYTRDCRPGMIAPNYDMQGVDLAFLAKSQAFLREHVKNSPNKPFFLFHSMQAVHLPSLPAPQFQGKSQAGPHGDFIYEMDWLVGQLLTTLDELGVADNTLVIIASDNGPEVASVVNMRKDYGHDGARPWRGMKRDAWEGGHRTPFIVRWPGKVKAGVTSTQLTSLTDIFATVAAIVGYDLPDGAAEDSYNMLPAWLGDGREPPVRPYLLEQTWTNQLSVRRGEWMYLDHRGSGGNNYDRSAELARYRIADTEPDAPGQLYNLADDPHEEINIYSKHPQIVADLKAILEASKQTGRSAPVRKAP